MARWLVGAALVISCGASAWGPYGHQQIHRLAIQRVSDVGFRRWLMKNESPGLRLSMTPDIDWRLFRDKPANEAAAYVQRRATAVEMATHFFDADIFSAGRLANGQLDLSHLKGAIDYSRAAEALEKALAENRPFFSAHEITRGLVRWDEPLRPQLPALGSAPWRILDLIDRAAGALERGTEYEALVYLSALGHYVGDMGVPHHTTAFFDGDSAASKGVHLALEMKMLDWIAEQAGSVRDPESELYPHYRATEPLVSSELERLGPIPVLTSEADLFNRILDLISAGHAYLAPLTNSYAVAKAEFPNLEKNWAPYLETKIAVAGRAITVKQAMVERMAVSAQLVAAAFQLTYRLRREKSGGRDGLVSTIHFGQSRAILDYPFPTYLNLDPPAPCYRRLNGHSGGAGPEAAGTFSGEKL